MKVKTLSALAGLGGALIMSGSADAAYVGLHWRLHTTVNAAGVNRDVFRIYAVFNNANDYLTGALGNVANPATIQSLSAAGAFPGSAFFNPAAGGNLAPSQDAVNAYPATVPWDTFATVGYAIVPGDGGAATTGTSPGFPTFISGNQWATNDGGWFTPGPQEHGRAGGFNGVTLQAGQGGPGGMGVLMMQLTVNQGNHVRGTIGVNWSIDVPLAGQQTGQSFNQTFNTFPAPGALALLGLAGLATSRRRRG
jgi:hypothetical protein